MSKCDNCSKTITKRTPGLECRSCGKVAHASPICSGLTGKQIAAIRNADGLDWTCNDCQQNSPNRKSSFIMPQDDDDEDEESVMASGNVNNCNMDTNKFLKDMTTQMTKVLKKELVPIETSLNFFSDKIDELFKIVESQCKNIKELEKKYTYLNNENTHLKLEMRALHQYVRESEQQRLENIIEVTGIPKGKDEKLNEITKKLAENLSMDSSQISNIKRIEGRNGQDGNVQVEFLQSENAEMWVRSSKKTPLIVEQIIPDAAASVSKSKVIIRRALTKANKTLLWQAQQKLRPSYKYVWFQDNKVLARKGDNEKPQVVRSCEDINSLLNGSGPKLNR